MSVCVFIPGWERWSTSSQRSTELLLPVWRLVVDVVQCGLFLYKLHECSDCVPLGGYFGELWGPLHRQTVEGLPSFCYLCRQANRSWEGKWQWTQYGCTRVPNKTGPNAPLVLFLCAQVQLKQVIPRTQLEQMEYSLAAERRRMRLLHAEIITDLLSSSTAQPGSGSSHGGSVTRFSAVRTADVVFLFWLSQENARSTRMPCRPSRREWRAWSWYCRRIRTTKSAPLGARLWRGWRTWLRFLRGVYKQPGPSSPQLPPGEH